MGRLVPFPTHQTDSKPIMENKRQKKVARLLQKELGDIFQRNAQNYFDGAFLTVTYVKVSPDLGQVKVYVSVLLSNPQIVMEKITDHARQIKMELASRIRNQMRVIPELSYYIDDTEEVAQKVEKLFENLHIPPAGPEGGDEA